MKTYKIQYKQKYRLLMIINLPILEITFEITSLCSLSPSVAFKYSSSSSDIHGSRSGLSLTHTNQISHHKQDTAPLTNCKFQVSTSTNKKNNKY